MRQLNDNAKSLGYLGILPQAAALVTVASGSEWGWTALAIAWGYAALIFSFLGGVWWGIGLTNERAPRWIFAASVLPSLIALASYVPWVLGLEWPEPSLILLGILLCLSPLVDRAIAKSVDLPEGWIKLRWHLSLGLGAITILIGALQP